MTTYISEAPTRWTVTPPPRWQDDAACQGLADLMDPAIWPTAAAVEQARSVCHGCPVRARCWAWAVQEPALTGIAAGLTENQRALLRGSRLNNVIRTRDGGKECGTCGQVRAIGWFPVDHSHNASGRGRHCQPCVTDKAAADRARQAATDD